MRRRSVGVVGLTTVMAMIGVLQPAVAQAGWRPDTWNKDASMAHARALAGVAMSAGMFYAVGGDSVTATAEAFNPSTHRWSNIPSMPTARGFLTAAGGGDGRLYAIGGYTRGSVATNAVEAYSPTTRAWATAAPLPYAAFGISSASAPDGSVYVMGGTDGISLFANAEVYTPATNLWTAIAPLLVPQYGSEATTGLDGRIYVLGGSGTTSNDAEVYSPGTNTWTELPPMLGEHFLGAAAAGRDGRIYAIGGDDASANPSSFVEAYNPVLDGWEVVPPLPEPREQSGAATGPHGAILVIGGWNYNSDSHFHPGALASVVGYFPPVSVTTVSPAQEATPGAAVTISGSGFAKVTTVTFGSSAAVRFTVNSATQITAIPPAGQPGTVDVRVTAGGLTSEVTPTDRYTFG